MKIGKYVTLLKILKIVYNATLSIGGVYYPTAPKVLLEYLNITAMFNEYKNMEFWKPLITVMEDIFFKYYEDMPLIFACAAALDPIIKVEGVEVILEEIESHLGTKNSKSVESFSRNFHELYNFTI